MEILMGLVFILILFFVPVIIIPEKKWTMFWVLLLVFWTGLGYIVCLTIALIKRFKVFEKEGNGKLPG